MTLQQRMSNVSSATCYCTSNAEMGRTDCAQMYHTVLQRNHQRTLHVQTCSVWRGKWSQHQLNQQWKIKWWPCVPKMWSKIIWFISLTLITINFLWQSLHFVIWNEYCSGKLKIMGSFRVSTLLLNRVISRVGDNVSNVFRIRVRFNGRGDISGLQPL